MIRRKKKLALKFQRFESSATSMSPLEQILQHDATCVTVSYAFPRVSAPGAVGVLETHACVAVVRGRAPLHGDRGHLVVGEDDEAGGGQGGV